MAVNPHSDRDSVDAYELIAITGTLLAEAEELSGPSVSDLLTFMLDRLPEYAGERRA